MFRNMHQPQMTPAPDHDTLYGDREECISTAAIENGDHQSNISFWHPLSWSWGLFSDTSTIHGVPHIGNKRHSCFTRVFFLLVVLAFGALCSYMVAQQFIQYLQFDVKTSTMIVQQDNLTFPAITFCNENIFRKSIVGGSLAFLEEFVAMYADSNTAYMELRQNYVPQCYNSTINNTITDALNMGQSYISILGVAPLLFKVAMDSRTNVLQCTWLGKPIDCSNLFLNHFTDYGWCFTFNPSNNIISSYNSDTAYGINNTNNTVPLSIINSGPQNGLQLILNAEQDDYCMTRGMSVGFRAVVHDPDVQPLFFMENAILLSPGFDISISIQATLMSRNTESLGRCKQFVPIYWYPNATVYFEQACYMGCYSEFVMKTCGCFPPFGPLQGYYLYKAQNPNSNLSLCFGPQFICMNDVSFTFYETSLGVQCPDCIVPCNEILYSYTTSFEYFPASTQSAILAQYNITDLVAARSNILHANFFIESLQITVITEDQAMLMTDLLGAVGGLLGLFLGMSVISIVEVLLQIPFSVKAIVHGVFITKKKHAFSRNHIMPKMPEKF